jgi:hydrogenase nickel incorporation protein HypA/HybF
MHELSVALALIEIATERIVRLGSVRVRAVHIKAGPLSGVDADALRFSFDAATAGTALAGARLEIDVPALVAWCATCDAEREVVSVATRRCLVCNNVAPRVVHGAELELVGLEVADA